MKISEKENKKVHIYSLTHTAEANERKKEGGSGNGRRETGKSLHRHKTHSNKRIDQPKVKIVKTF